MGHNIDTNVVEENQVQEDFNEDGRIAFLPNKELRAWLISKTKAGVGRSLGKTAEKMLDRMMFLDQHGFLPKLEKIELERAAA